MLRFNPSTTCQRYQDKTNGRSAIPTLFLKEPVWKHFHEVDASCNSESNIQISTWKVNSNLYNQAIPKARQENLHSQSEVSWPDIWLENRKLMKISIIKWRGKPHLWKDKRKTQDSPNRQKDIFTTNKRNLHETIMVCTLRVNYHKYQYPSWRNSKLLWLLASSQCPQKHLFSGFRISKDAHNVRHLKICSYFRASVWPGHDRNLHGSPITQHF